MKISIRILPALLAAILTYSCCPHRSTDSDIARDGVAPDHAVRLELTVKDVRKNENGELCANMLVANHSPFAVLLNVPKRGLTHSVDMEARIPKGAYELYLHGSPGLTMRVAGGESPHYLVLHGTHGGTNAWCEGIHVQEIVLVTKEEYAKLQQTLAGRPAKFTVRTSLRYLRSCSGVDGGNAEGVVRAAYVLLKLEREVEATLP